MSEEQNIDQSEAPSMKIEDVALRMAEQMRDQLDIGDISIMTMIVGMPDGRLIPATFPSSGGALQQLEVIASANRVCVSMLKQAIIQGSPGVDPEEAARIKKDQTEARLRLKFGMGS